MNRVTKVARERRCGLAIRHFLLFFNFDFASREKILFDHKIASSAPQSQWIQYSRRACDPLSRSLNSGLIFGYIVVTLAYAICGPGGFARLVVSSSAGTARRTSRPGRVGIERSEGGGGRREREGTCDPRTVERITTVRLDGKWRPENQGVAGRNYQITHQSGCLVRSSGGSKSRWEMKKAARGGRL